MNTNEQLSDVPIKELFTVARWKHMMNMILIQSPQTLTNTNFTLQHVQRFCFSENSLSRTGNNTNVIHRRNRMACMHDVTRTFPTSDVSDTWDRGHQAPHRKPARGNFQHETEDSRTAEVLSVENLSRGQLWARTTDQVVVWPSHLHSWER